MRIDSYSQIQQLYNNTQKVTTAKPQVGKGGSFMDKLQLSDAGKDMQVVRAGLAQTPDVRADKIAALKSAYEAGTYQVSTSDLADKLLEKATETAIF